MNSYPPPNGTSREIGVTTSDLSSAKFSSGRVQLHLNESPFGMSERLLAAAVEELQCINRYPEPGSPTATQAIARRHSVDPGNVFLGNGCDELILLAILTLASGGQVISTANTYPGYRAAARLADIDFKDVPLREWRVDLDLVLNATTNRTRIAIVCNPHNPCGSYLDPDAIASFVKNCNERHVIPILDEAYIDFAPRSARNSIDLVAKSADALVLRTFSKAAGLAGLRIGYAIGSPWIVSKLRAGAEAVPFNVNRIAQRVAIELCSRSNGVEGRVREIIRRRELVQSKLTQLGVWHLPSNANFVFISPGSSLSSQVAARDGVYVRDCEPTGFPGCWRVSIGGVQEMDRFLEWLSLNMLKATGSYNG